MQNLDFHAVSSAILLQACQVSIQGWLWKTHSPASRRVGATYNPHRFATFGHQTTPRLRRFLCHQIGAVGEDICVPCEAGRFTEADGGSTSAEQCVACGVDFEVR